MGRLSYNLEGGLRVLLKGEDKDVKDLKSYRPICLLPVIGKLFEKFLKMRLTRYWRQEGTPIDSSDLFSEQVDGGRGRGVAASGFCLRREVHCDVALRHFRCL